MEPDYRIQLPTKLSLAKILDGDTLKRSAFPPSTPRLVKEASRSHGRAEEATLEDNSAHNLIVMFLALGALIASLLAPLPLEAQQTGWRSANKGFYGGDISKVAAKGSTVFALSGRGVYRSFDNGVTWNTANAGLSLKAIRESFEFAIVGERIFLCGADGLFYSDNDGAIWRRSETQGISKNFAPAQLFSPGGGALFVTAAQSFPQLPFSQSSPQLFRSTDKGTSWENVSLIPNQSSFPTITGIEALADKDGKMLSVVAVTLEDGAFRSADEGKTWKKITDGGLEGETSFQALGKAGEALFASARFTGKLFISNDGGVTWKKIQEAIGSVVVFGSFAGKIYIGNQATLAGRANAFRSADGGATWEGSKVCLSGWNYPLPIRSFAANSTTIFAATSYGLLRSLDAGATWTESQTGIEAIRVGAISANDDALFVSNDYRVFRSLDVGRSWQISFQSDSNQSGTLHFTSSPNNTLAGATNFGVLRSRDNGVTWSASNEGLLRQNGYAYPIFSLAARDATAFAGSGGQVFRSSDGGGSWRSVYLSGGGNSDGVLFEAVAFSSSAAFASAWNGAAGLLARSLDNGDSWQTAAVGLPNTARLIALAASGNNVFAGANKQGIFRSTDNGTGWQAANTGLPSNAFSPRSFLIDGQKVYVVMSDGDGVYRSTNGGASWEAFGKDLPEGVVAGSITKQGNALFLGTYNGGVYTTSDTSASAPVTAMREDSHPSPSLSASPNPAADSFVLRYELAEAVSAEIYAVNALGQTRVLQAPATQTAGAYALEINSADWAAGVYSLTLRAGGRTLRLPLVVRR